MSKTYYEMLKEKLKNDPLYLLEKKKIDITEQIWKIMEEEGISKSELAKRMGVSRGYITRILGGNTNFTLESLIKISMALKTDLQITFSPKVKARRAKSPSIPSIGSFNIKNNIKWEDLHDTFKEDFISSAA